MAGCPCGAGSTYSKCCKPYIDGVKQAQKLPDELVKGVLGLVDWLLSWRLSREHLLRIMPLMRERIKRLDEFIPGTEYFFSGDLDLAPVADKLKMGDMPKKRRVQGDPGSAARRIPRP